MDQAQNPKNEESADSNSQSKRNPLERLIVWGGITILLIIVGIEYRAKQSYDASIAALQKVANGVRDVPIEEARELMVGYSQEHSSQSDDQGSKTYSYQWFSLFKGGTYQLRLVEDEDHLLKAFDGPAFAEDPEVLAAKIKAANSDVGESNPPLIGNALPQGPDGETISEGSTAEPQKTQEESNLSKEDLLN
ncbi:hypothetical protein [Gimesia sp.]|uniref:hypothetical protein n=1 Tax=Gimesia sp. TaxID=2024833 RepID=UPI003A93EBF4